LLSQKEKDLLNRRTKKIQVHKTKIGNVQKTIKPRIKNVIEMKTEV
jgi:hypothetical protein